MMDDNYDTRLCIVHHTSQNLTDSCNATRIPASNSTSYNEQHVASVAVTSIVTLWYTLLCALTTNHVRWMFLLVSSVHAVECQEKIPSGEHRFMLRNPNDSMIAVSRNWRIQL